MNPALIATFTAVSADLLTVMGAEATLAHAGETVPIRAILDTVVVPVGDYGERMEARNTLTVVRASGATVGDTVILNGTGWSLAQLTDDDGFVLKFAVRENA